MHTKDLDTFALPVRFSTLPAFVQLPNYLPIKPPIYAICTWKNKKREGGVCDVTKRLHPGTYLNFNSYNFPGFKSEEP